MKIWKLLLIGALSSVAFATPKECYDAYESKDYPLAYKLCLDEANNKDPKAQINLGKMYLLGQGIEKNPSISLKWFQNAADQNYAEGQLEIS